MLSISSTMVSTEALRVIFTHRQLDLSVNLLWGLLKTKFKGILVSVRVMLCKLKLKRMNRNTGVSDATYDQLLFIFTVNSFHFCI